MKNLDFFTLGLLFLAVIRTQWPKLELLSSLCTSDLIKGLPMRGAASSNFDQVQVELLATLIHNKFTRELDLRKLQPGVSNWDPYIVDFDNGNGMLRFGDEPNPDHRDSIPLVGYLFVN
jgi:hypothetical protein